MHASAVDPHIPAAESKVFLRLWSAVKSRSDAKVGENFLSECVGGVLNADLAFARAFVRRLNRNRDRLSGVSLSRSSIRAVPQFSCKSRGRQCFVDLRIDVGERIKIGVEVKLEAPEGVHHSGDRQLSKYLAIPGLTHIAFITDYAAPVEPKVINARSRYLTPSKKRQHFVWSDFYPDVLASARRRTAPYLAQSLLELFHERHLEPVHPDLPDLTTVEGRSAFRPLWDDARKVLQRTYEHVAPARINATMYSWNNDLSGGAWKIALEPAAFPGLLRIWLYMENRKVQIRAGKALDDMFRASRGAFRGASLELRKGDTSPGISVFVPYRALFKRRSSVASKRRRLASAVRTILSEIHTAS